jgi:Xaa-Pro dipeptidase
MHTEQRRRAADLFKSRGTEFALLANPANVTWLSGHALPVLTGMSPFAGGPSLVWYEDGEFTLIAMEGTTGGADTEVISYPWFTYQGPITSSEKLADIVGGLLKKAGRRPVGAELRHLPAQFKPEEAVVVDGWLDPLRMVKTADELVLMRRLFDLTGCGHRAARQGLQVGMREIDVWGLVATEVERQAGRRAALACDCVVSHRQDNSGGWPQDHQIRQGDSLILDLGVGLDGYWTDSCGTYYPGEPDREQAALHRAVEETLVYATSLVKPGAAASEIDRRMREFLKKAGYADYPHHSGHGIGTVTHEEPRITPYNPLRLQAGMVIMLEPGGYIPSKNAVRLENAVLVTEDGCEVLTHHLSS